MLFGGALRPLRFPKCFNKVALSFGKTEKFDKCSTGLRAPPGEAARAQKKKKGHVKNRTKILNMKKVKSKKKKVAWLCSALHNMVLHNMTSTGTELQYITLC